MLSSEACRGKPCFHLAIVWLRNGFWSLLTQRLLRGGRCSMNDESDKDMCFSFYSVPKCYVCGLNHCVFVRRPSICCDPKGNIWFISFCRFCLFQYSPLLSLSPSLPLPSFFSRLIDEMMNSKSALFCSSIAVCTLKVLWPLTFNTYWLSTGFAGAFEYYNILMIQTKRKHLYLRSSLWGEMQRHQLELYF